MKNDEEQQRNCRQEAVLAQRYAPTEAERNALAEHLSKKKKRFPCPAVKLQGEGPTKTIVVDHPDLSVGYALLKQALGSTDRDFVGGLVVQLANATAQDGKEDEDGLNFMLSVVKSIAPQDEIESMLAAQMGAVHMMTMSFTSRLANASTIQQQESAERALNKLARTFAAQLEALKRYRTGGQQKVTVEHVHVHEGGQAIVGHVEHRSEGGRS